VLYRKPEGVPEVLRKILGPRGRKEQENGEKYIVRSFMICTVRRVMKSRRK
jgi:hypothetical protein